MTRRIMILLSILLSSSCESKRFLQYYQTDPYDQKNYDFVIDTTLISAEQAAEMIKEFVESQ